MEYTYDYRQHLNVQQTSKIWSQALLCHDSIKVEALKKTDIAQCAILLAAMRPTVIDQSTALDLAIEMEEFGALQLNPDGTSSRCIRFTAHASPDVLTYDTNERKCRRLSVRAYAALVRKVEIGPCLQGGKNSDVQKLCVACLSEMLKDKNVILTCMGLAAFHRTFQALRLLRRELSKSGKELCFTVLLQRVQQYQTTKRILLFEFHLHKPLSSASFDLKL